MIAPPLIISEPEVDEAMVILDTALILADQEADVATQPYSKSSVFD